MTNQMPELQRISRVLQMVSLIANHPNRWRRKALSERFSVSERQISKDLDLIRHGLRYELPPSKGGYAFTTVPRLPAVSYSLPEALAILLAAQAASQMPGVPHGDLAKAIGRIISIMPAEFHPLLTSDGFFPTTTPNHHREEVLEKLTQAISMRRSVQMTYMPASRPGETTERRVDPYALLPYAPSWHLVGWCHLRTSVRIFKIDRMKDVTISDQGYNPNPEFDLNEFLAAGWGVTRIADQPVEDIELNFSQTAGRWVAEEQWHPSQSFTWLEDGRLNFRLRIPITDEFARWVFRYGKECEVIRPDHLREWIIDQARAVIGSYEGVGVGD